MLVPLLVVGLIAVYLAFDSNHPTSPELEECTTARALLITYFAPTGEWGAFTEKGTGERLAVERILAGESEVGDPTIKASLEKFRANTEDNGGFPDPGAIAELVQTCRAKKYVP